MVLHTLFSSDRINEKPNKMNLGAPTYPRALPELPSPRLGKHIFEATVH
jgi:hypothetical protein